MRVERAIARTCVQATPQFYDCDPMGVVWHGNYPRFLELGRVAVLQKIDYGYARMSESGYAWPVIDMGIRYAHPVNLHTDVEVETGIVEWENRLKLAFEIRDAQTRKRLTRGYAVHVAVDIATGEMLWETPAILRQKLEPFL